MHEPFLIEPHLIFNHLEMRITLTAVSDFGEDHGRIDPRRRVFQISGVDIRPAADNQQIEGSFNVELDPVPAPYRGQECHKSPRLIYDMFPDLDIAPRAVLRMIALSFAVAFPFGTSFDRIRVLRDIELAEVGSVDLQRYEALLVAFEVPSVSFRKEPPLSEVLNALSHVRKISDFLDAHRACEYRGCFGPG